ncbi:PAS domain S-box protein [Nostoc sp. CHAB 5824]|nr:PAS domain S-box protein [Nostoc sp. CHAB 5824]
MQKDNILHPAEELISNCPLRHQQENFSVAFLLQIINGTEDPIFVKDRQHRWVLLNDAFCNFLKHSREELIGKSDYDFLSKVEADVLWEKDELVFMSGIANENEESFTDIQGQTRFISTQKCLFEDGAGNKFLVGSIRDVTQYKRLEAKFQKLSANVPGMLYQFMLHPNNSFSFPYVNSGCYEIYGLTPEEIQADANLITLMVHPDESEDFAQSIALSAQTLQPWQWEGQIVLPSGQVKWIQGASRPELQADGSIIWDGLIIDVTSRKQVEEALHEAYAELEKRVLERTKELATSNEALQAEITEREQAEAQLLEKEQFLRSVYDGSEHAIFVLDFLVNGDFCYTGWNPATERATGISSSEVIGTTPEDVHGAVEGAAVRQRYIKCLETGVPVSYEECLTFQSQETWWITTINPLKDNEGKIYRLVGTTFNITERIRAETQIKQQAEDLETALQKLQRTQMQLVQSEKMSALGQLVAGIAHEINNPVSFIYGNLTHANEYIQDLVRLLQLYQQQYPQPLTPIQELETEIDLEFLIKDLFKLLDSMKIGTQRIREIVLSLRNFSRMDEAEMKEVNIHEGIDSTLMILEHRIKATPDRPAIQVIKEYSNLPLVECYAGQLNQVFMNILANAIDALEESFVVCHTLREAEAASTSLAFSSTGQMISPQIHIRTQLLEPNKVIILIADNGPGMSKEVKQRLFDPFFSTKPIGKGTGMGLSICYQIISKKHGGTLECLSQLGNGAEFVITIPRSQG